jgi:hypothetical protein
VNRSKKYDIGDLVAGGNCLTGHVQTRGRTYPTKLFWSLVKEPEQVQLTKSFWSVGQVRTGNRKSPVLSSGIWQFGSDKSGFFLEVGLEICF